MLCCFKCLGVNRAGPGERRGPVTGRGSSGAPQVTRRRERDLASELCHTAARCLRRPRVWGWRSCLWSPKGGRKQNINNRRGGLGARPRPRRPPPPPPRAPGGPGPALPPRPRGRGVFAVPHRSCGFAHPRIPRAGPRLPAP